MLEVSGLKAWYGATQALFDVNLRVEPGQTLALVGLNGAGKTTTVRAIAGLIRTEGKISVGSRDVSRVPAHVRVRRDGLCVVHEGRGLFPQMTVLENLLVGASKPQAGRLELALEVFPALRARLSATVSDLSGGQQQMVALARVVLRQPSVLLLDEPSLGLAPIAVDEVYERLGSMRLEGIATLLVEQNVSRAVETADRISLIRTGRTVRNFDARSVTSVAELSAELLGT